MPRYFAFLRAVNVGGRLVKMDALRKSFEEIGLAKVETFIASGNVIFESSARSSGKLEKQIEAQLRSSFGFEIPALVRSTAELAEVARYRPFSDEDLDADGHALYIVFLPTPPTAEAIEKVMALKTETDEFYVHGREIYWLCRIKISDSKVSGPMLEKAAGMHSTSRNSTTVRKLAAKYPPA